MAIDRKIGILGAGQLGKMLAIEGARWDLHIEALDSSPDVPAAQVVKKLHIGKFNDYEDVLKFGRQMDIIGIEIEHVNTDALRQLQKEGKTVIPEPDTLDIIKDKGLQKLFYQEQGLPSADFKLYTDKEELLAAIETGQRPYPFVQKSRSAGYDGKGVAVIKNADDLGKLLEGPSLAEDAVSINKELAIIVARRPSGQVKTFPVVEMLFNPEANLVENLICPAEISKELAGQIDKLAHKIANAFQITGLLAIELFLDTDGQILINEVAPRPHNSGHHTIEANITCQYQQQLRALLDLPLGDTSTVQPSMMLNLLGAAGHTGNAYYEGLETVLDIPGVFVHIYGKKITKPFRKMGHVTIVGKDTEELEAKATLIRSSLKVISK